MNDILCVLITLEENTPQSQQSLLSILINSLTHLNGPKILSGLCKGNLKARFLFKKLSLATAL